MKNLFSSGKRIIRSYNFIQKLRSPRVRRTVRVEAHIFARAVNGILCARDDILDDGMRRSFRSSTVG